MANRGGRGGNRGRGRPKKRPLNPTREILDQINIEEEDEEEIHIEKKPKMVDALRAALARKKIKQEILEEAEDSGEEEEVPKKPFDFKKRGKEQELREGKQASKEKMAAAETGKVLDAKREVKERKLKEVESKKVTTNILKKMREEEEEEEEVEEEEEEEVEEEEREEVEERDWEAVLLEGHEEENLEEEEEEEEREVEEEQQLQQEEPEEQPEGGVEEEQNNVFLYEGQEEIFDEEAEGFDIPVTRGLNLRPVRLVTLAESANANPDQPNYRLLQDCVYAYVDGQNTREVHGYFGPRVKIGAFFDGISSKTMTNRYTSQYGKQRLEDLYGERPSRGILRNVEFTMADAPGAIKGYDVLEAHVFLTVPNFENLTRCYRTVEQVVPGVFEDHRSSGYNGAHAVIPFEEPFGPRGGKLQDQPRFIWVWYPGKERSQDSYRVDLRMKDPTDPSRGNSRLSGAISFRREGWKRLVQVSPHIIDEARKVSARMVCPAHSGSGDKDDKHNAGKQELTKCITEILEKTVEDIDERIRRDFELWTTMVQRKFGGEDFVKKMMYLLFSDRYGHYDFGVLSKNEIRGYLNRVIQTPNSVEQTDVLIQVYDNVIMGVSLSENRERKKRKSHGEGEPGSKESVGITGGSSSGSLDLGDVVKKKQGGSKGEQRGSGISGGMKRVDVKKKQVGNKGEQGGSRVGGDVKKRGVEKKRGSAKEAEDLEIRLGRMSSVIKAVVGKAQKFEMV